MARTIEPQGRRHRAVPAREGGAAHPGPRRHRPAGGELHGLHAVRPQLPRLVHLHRGPQGEGAAPPRRAASRARSARSTASTSTTRCACTAASASRSARSTPCSGARSTSTPSPASPTCSTTRTGSASGWRPCPRRPSLEAGADKKQEVPRCSPPTSDVAQNIAFGIIAAVMVVGAAPRRHDQQRRARRAVAGDRAGRRRPPSTSCWPPSSSPSPRSSSTSAPSSCCSCSASCSPAPRSAGERRPQQPRAGRSALLVALMLLGAARLRR